MNVAKKKYSDFCESIQTSISSINAVGVSDAEDQLLIDILLGKIDSYYSLLQIDTLEKEHIVIENNYNTSKKKLNVLKNHFLKDINLCSICSENQVEYFLDPCGHTLCGGCKEKCTSKTNCHYCRTNRKAFKKIFY